MITSIGWVVAITAVVSLTIVQMIDWSDDMQGLALHIVGRSGKWRPVQERKSVKYNNVVPRVFDKRIDPAGHSR